MGEKEFALNCGEPEADKLSMYTILDLLSQTTKKLIAVKQDSEALLSDLCLGNLNHTSLLPNKDDKKENPDANLVTEFYSKLQDINIAIELIQKDILYSNYLVK